MTKQDIDDFYRFAVARLDGDLADGSLEDCIAAWRRQAGREPFDGEPLPDGKSLADALRDAGILGASKSGPPDLSTNPKYMEGFGES